MVRHAYRTKSTQKSEPTITSELAHLRRGSRWPAMNLIAATVTTLCTGLTADVYLAFSTMMMPALAGTSPARALMILRRINAERPVFLIRFPRRGRRVGLGADRQWLPDGGRDVRITTASELSLGRLRHTVLFHVPRNRQTAVLNADVA